MSTEVKMYPGPKGAGTRIEHSPCAVTLGQEGNAVHIQSLAQHRTSHMVQGAPGAAVVMGAAPKTSPKLGTKPELKPKTAKNEVQKPELTPETAEAELSEEKLAQQLRSEYSHKELKQFASEAKIKGRGRMDDVELSVALAAHSMARDAADKEKENGE